MDKKQYDEYVLAIYDTMQKDGIDSLCIAYDGSDLDEDGASFCPSCNQEVFPESFFSHTPCDICNSSLGGDRYHATGYNRDLDEIYCYDVCMDCLYFAEYGRLDDQTMMDISEE